MGTESLTQYKKLSRNKSGPDENGLRSGIALLNTKLEGGFFIDEIEFDWRKNLKYNRFDKNPSLVVDHGMGVDDVVGFINERATTPDGLNIKFSPAPTQRAEQVFQMWDEGYVKGLSIWHSPLPGEDTFEYDAEEDIFRLIIGESELNNVSIVSVPRDPDSLKNSNTNLTEYDLYNMTSEIMGGNMRITGISSTTRYAMIDAYNNRLKNPTYTQRKERDQAEAEAKEREARTNLNNTLLNALEVN